MQLHGAYRTGKKRILKRSAKQFQCCITWTVFDQRVHLDADFFPFVIVADGGISDTFGSRPRHLVFTGSAVTFTARLTVRSDTASRLFDTLCIIHRSVPSSFVCKSEFLSVMIHTPVDASFQIMHIIRVLTHSLARSIGNLCDIHTVAQRGFHDDIQCRYLRII